MKIALVLGTSTGGVGRHVRDLVAGLVQAGDQVSVAAPQDVLDRFGYAALGASTVPLPLADRPHPRHDARAVARLRALSARHEVVHAHGARAGALCALALPATTPLVVTMHNGPPEQPLLRPLHAGLELAVARRADLVLAVSSDLVRSAVRRGARRAQRAVVPASRAGTVHRDRFTVRAALEVPPEAALLVTVARIAPQKGLDTLLDGIDLLRRRYEVPAHAVVAGDGDDDLRARLQERIDAQALPVTLLGHRDDIADLLAAADVVVSTARWEGQPVALQEALHLGCAIVATDAGGTGDVVGDAAVLVPVGDPASLASALADVVRHGGVRDALRSEAVHRAAALPDLEAALAAARTAYESAIAARQGRERRAPRRRFMT